MSEDHDASWGWGVDESPQEDDDVVVQENPAAQLQPPGDDDDDDGDDRSPLLPGRQGSRTHASMGDSIIGKPSHMAQYITALAATMGALSMGAILGYSSPAGSQLKGPELAPNVTLNVSNIDCPLIHDEPLTDNQISWFGSTVNIGALIGAPLGGVCINLIGRRTTMVATIAPFLLGWFLIEFANNFAMLVAGRIFCGICCGLVSLSVPTYIGEIASPDIRGLLGTGFQLMVVIGILYVYSLGAGLCWQWIALLCLIPAVVFCVAMFFSKESPVFLLSKKKSQEAREALQFFRGEHYNIEPELQQLTQSIEEAQRNKASFRDLKTPYILKPLLISLALMFFQQTSGINAILFNLNEIFKSAHVDLGENASSIIIAAVQVVATCLGAVLMDRAGRKLLLILSAGAMCISLVGMGAYFFVSEQDDKNDTTNADSLGWLPLLSMIIFITFFSIGFGPIPWLMMGELFSAEVRELASTLATLTNWLLSFIVTLVFQPLIDAINNSGVYWLFAIFCACSFVFSLLVVKETKGKTIEEITFMFGGPPPNAGGNAAPKLSVVVSPPSGEDERKRSTASSSSSSASEGADNKGFVA